jgi:polyhydroxybutyrate depolymerase
MTKLPYAIQSLVSFGVMFAAGACSSDDGSEGGMTSTATPAASPAMMAEPTPPPEMANPAERPSGTAPNEASREGPPMVVDLTPPPAESNGAPAAGPMAPSAAAPSETVPSAACSAPATAAAASGRFTIDVAGNPRDYILALPQGYDATHPYRLVFTWHPGGGTAQQTAQNYYGLQRLAADSTIFVSPEGISNGWANTGGRDIAFLDAMLARFKEELCIDQNRIFSTGFSYGGMMSFAVGCGRADVFRAIAPMSGALYSGCADGDTPIAMLGFHGTTDTTVPIANGRAARDVIAERDGCQPAAMAIQSNGCSSFQGCSEGHSVTWCEFNGGHMPAPQSAQKIWDFFSQF